MLQHLVPLPRASQAASDRDIATSIKPTSRIGGQSGAPGSADMASECTASLQHHRLSSETVRQQVGPPIACWDSFISEPCP